MCEHEQKQQNMRVRTLCTALSCSNLLRSCGTGIRVHGQPSQQACVPPVIQVFEFAACEGIQASV